MNYYDDESGGYGGLGILLGFVFGAMILAVSANIWIALALNITCLVIVNMYVNSVFFSGLFSTALGFPMLLLLFILFSRKKSGNTWFESYSNAYRENRLQALEWLEKWFRNFGLSSKTEIPVMRRIVYKNGKLEFFDYVSDLKRLTKKADLLPDWKYRAFWYVTGYSPISTKELIPKNSFILMTCIPLDYGDKVFNHRYCLVCPSITDNFIDAVLASTKNIPPDASCIIAVSLGPTEYSLNSGEIDYRYD